MPNVIPTPEQLAELDELNTAVQNDGVERAKAADAAASASNAVAFAAAKEAEAKAALAAADEKESKDLLKLQEFVNRLFNPVVGVVPDWGTPERRTTVPTVKFVKKGQHSMKSAAAGGPKTMTGDLVAEDNMSGTLTMNGVDSQGAMVDISGSAALTSATSDAPSILAFDPPSGVTDHYNALLPGTANATFVVTPNDGSPALTVTSKATVTGSKATGLSVDWGTPTVRT